MRKIAGTSLLILALACVTYAGDIPNNVTVKGDIPNNVTVAGDIPNNVADTTEQQTLAGVAPEVALNLLAGVLTLF